MATTTPQKINPEYSDFFKNCNNLADLIDAKKSELHRHLQAYETFDVIEDEIERSTTTLRGMVQEIGGIFNPQKDLNISTFFPLNLPLYSLVLFGIAPSVFSKNVFIRPPEVMYEILDILWKVLEIPKYFPNILLTPSPRHIFVQLYAADSDVIIFTGKYENAIDIHNKCPEALLVYNGSGVNPFLIFDNGDIDLAVEKAVEMRCFNSGQDCAGPDAFFVPSSKIKEFNEKLISKLNGIKVGPSSDSSVQVGPIRKIAYIDELTKWLVPHKNEIIFGGSIDRKNNLVYPTIVNRKITIDDKENFHEFFAPYFYVLEYEDLDLLKNLMLSKSFMNRGMYVSVFGQNDEFERLLSFVRLLRNVIVNDVEYGNSEYGGYGVQSNFLLYGKRKDVHPILISRDIQKSLN
jgi:acyl-CoA reductase-like NAD-dependent aldehyde dehydrogenase